MAAALLLGASPARAEGEIRAHLTYSAHAGCPSADRFREGVSRRTSKVIWEQSGRAIAVLLSPRPAGRTAGRLSIGDPSGGAPSRREVEDRSCEAVVDALALVAALAFDPGATLVLAPEPVPPEPVPPEPVPPEPAPSEPARPESALPELALARPVPRATPAPEPDRPPRGQERRRWRGAVGVQAQGASGLGRSFLAVLPVFGELALEGSGWLAPAFRLGLAWMPTREMGPGDGGGAFWRIAVQGSGCPVAWAPARWLRLRPCAGLEVGSLQASGLRLDETKSTSTGWAAVRALGRTQVFPNDWALLEVQAELGLPLVRPRFVIEPDETVVSVAPVYAVFGGGVGVRIP